MFGGMDFYIGDTQLKRFFRYYRTNRIEVEMIYLYPQRIKLNRFM